MPASRRTILAVLAAATVVVLAARRLAACLNRVAGPEDEAVAAARYRHMIGEDLPPKVRLEQARRLAVGAPIRRVHRRPDGLYLEVSL